MSASQFPSLEQMFAEIEKEVLANCVRCGDCIRACPISLEGPYKDKAPEDMVDKLFAVLETGTFSEEAYFTAYSCMGCELCSGVCPQGINPVLFRQVVRNKLLAMGNTPPRGFIPREPSPLEVLQCIQIKPSEARWLREAPSSPGKKDVVVFIGCAGMVAPDKNFALIDVLEKMGIDFTALLGGKICCGNIPLFAGDLQTADFLARNLIENIESFSPKKLILTCPSCYNMVKNIYPRFLSYDFEVEYLPTFLGKNLHKLKFTTPLDKKITLHEPCHLARGFKDFASPRKVLEALPGLELREMAHNRENALCCGGYLSIAYPDYGMKIGQKLLQEAQNADVDAMVNLCPGCHLSLCGLGVDYPFELSDLPSLINEAIGGRKYEDSLKPYWECRDVNKILEKARTCFEAHGFSREEMEKMIPRLFGLSSKDDRE